MMHHADLERYAAANTSMPEKHLVELYAATCKLPNGRMASDPLQGSVLAMLSHMIRPRRVLEIGSFTGYATHCLCAGIQQEGEVHTIEKDTRLASMLTQNLESLRAKCSVHIHWGDAHTIVAEIPQDKVFDLIFIDADKRGYADYYAMCMERISAQGFMVIDNMFWYGKVCLPAEEQDARTRSLVEFAQQLAADSRIVRVLLPIRDGLMVVRRQ